MSASLNNSYERNVRPCIDLIDSLRALGVEKDLALPTIAVIGDQSSGKSSVLEALSGVALPRGSGVVTRCPLELKMKKSRNEDFWHGKINYKDYEGEIKNSADVEKIIRKAQNEIAGALGISDELISLEITSPNVPNLTLIDLPGIVRVSIRGQPEDIGEQSKSVIRKFITNQNTILLVVVPCNVDIATTEALRMAQEVDPYGERTLGILTKPDLVDRGMEDAVLSIINNEAIYLSKGYMIVRCRGQQEIMENISLHEAMRKERDFFNTHPYFSKLYDEKKATIHNLADKLTHELVHHIEQSLPLLKEQIQSKLAETQGELNRYGSGAPTDPEEKIVFLTNKITAFNQDAINLTAGEELKNLPQVNIFSSLRKEFADWKTDLQKSEEKFKKVIEKELKEYEEKYRGRECPGFLNYQAFEVIVRNQIKELEEPAVARMNDISDLIMNILIHLSEANFKEFPQILKIAKTKIENIKETKEKEAESMLRTQFRMELMVYTQDSMYSDSLKKLKLMEEKAERQAHGVAYPRSGGLYKQSDIEDAMEELTRHLKSYYSIASRRLADQVPMVIRYIMLQESAKQLQREMLQLMRLNDIDVLLEETDDIYIKRNNLKSRQDRLKKALKKIIIS
ncbi:interferon-induced GTP-binding protein Mx1-like [Clarias gariepinus]